MSALKWFQLGWTLVACGGLLFQMWVLRDVGKDRGSIDSRSSRWTWWREYLRGWGLGWVLLVYALVGLYAFLSPPPSSPDRSVWGSLVALGFISAELVLVAISAFSVYVRRHVREIERAEILDELLRESERG